MRSYAMANPKILYNRSKITPDRVLSEKFKHDVMSPDTFALTDGERSLLLNYLNQISLVTLS